ncbi:MAG: rhodanese-like domain-containing protein [Geobacter sp.]|nr:MAG: rhodanese-like domain-containing protein [Geobacter sp.]
MHQSTKRLLREMAIICLMAATIGIAWNHRLLLNAWTGNVPANPPVPASIPPSQAGQRQPAVPLPLGLMQVKEFHDRKEAVIVDARDGATFTAGHITGAVSLPLGEADARLAEFAKRYPPTTLLVVYCNGYDCHDSHNLAAKLIAAGYTTVFVFEGGFPEWEAAGYPVTGGKP